MDVRLFPEPLYERHEPRIMELLTDVFTVNHIADGKAAVSLATEKAMALKHYLADGSALLIGAFEGEQLMGFAWFYSYEFCGSQRLHLTEIAVISAFRSQGIAKKMICCAEKIAAQRGICEIDLYTAPDNKAALHVYQELGFIASRVHLVKKLKEKQDGNF